MRASASSGKRIAIKEILLNVNVVGPDPDPVGSGTFWLLIRNNCTGSGSGTELLTRKSVYCKLYNFFFKKCSNSSLMKVHTNFL